MRTLTAWWLGIFLCVGVLTMWILGRWVNPSLLEAGVLVAVGAWAARSVWKPGEVVWSWGMAPVALAAGWGLLQLYWGVTVGKWETQNATALWAVNLGAFWVAAQVGASKRAARRLLDIVLVFGFVISVVTILQVVSAPGKVFWVFEGFSQSFGPFENRDRYAAYAELLLAVAIARGLEESRMAQFALGTAATLVAVTIAGASRAGSTLVVAESVAVVLAAGMSGAFPMPRVKGVAARLGVLVVVFTAVVGVGVLLSRFDTTDPYGARREYVQSSIRMVTERPWMGFGLGNFENVYGGYAIADLNRIVNHAHNDWAEWAVDGGLPFLGFMVWFAVWVGPKAWRCVWGLGVVTMLVHSLVDFGLQSPVLQIWMFVFAGLMAGEKMAGQKPSESR